MDTDRYMPILGTKAIVAETTIPTRYGAWRFWLLGGGVVVGRYDSAWGGCGLIGLFVWSDGELTGVGDVMSDDVEEKVVAWLCSDR